MNLIPTPALRRQLDDAITARTTLDRRITALVAALMARTDHPVTDWQRVAHQNLARMNRWHTRHIRHAEVVRHDVYRANEKRAKDDRKLARERRRELADAQTARRKEAA